MIGGYDLEKYADPKENGKIHWIKLKPEGDKENYYWTLGIDKITLGEIDIKSKAVGALMDSGTSFITQPSSDYKTFLKYMSEK